MIPKNFLIITIIVAITSLAFSQSEAKPYYVAASGGGNSCTKESPCSLQEGLKKAEQGDELILLNGNYKQLVDTKNAGVTIRAEHQHQATISNPKKSEKSFFNVRHANVTVQGIRIDGNNYGQGAVAIRYPAHDVIFEDNIIQNTGGPGLYVSFGGGQYNLIIRHNLIEDTGNWFHAGEGMYLGDNDRSSKLIKNVEIYGNTIRNFTDECMNLKWGARNYHIHHNICENQSSPAAKGVKDNKTQTPGGINLQGEGHRVHDNISRNLKSSASWSGALIFLETNKNVDIYKNVFSQGDVGYAISGNEKAAKSDNVTIYNNTFCNLSSHKIKGEVSNFKMYNNNGVPGEGAPQKDCDAEINRIIDEMKSLPGKQPSTGQAKILPPSRLEIVHVQP